jgi:hypothetical protein
MMQVLKLYPITINELAKDTKFLLNKLLCMIIFIVKSSAVFFVRFERAWQIYGNVRLKASGAQQKTDQLAFCFQKRNMTDRKNPV